MGIIMVYKPTYNLGGPILQDWTIIHLHSPNPRQTRGSTPMIRTRVVQSTRIGIPWGSAPPKIYQRIPPKKNTF